MVQAGNNFQVLTLDTAATFAQLTTAMADAQIAVYNDKYFYREWRPVTVIQESDLDGNHATIADPAWTSLVTTPAFPSYISAHSALSEAAALTLAASFGDTNSFCLTLAFCDRCFTSLNGAATDASNSRVWGASTIASISTLGSSWGSRSVPWYWMPVRSARHLSQRLGF